MVNDGGSYSGVAQLGIAQGETAQGEAAQAEVSPASIAQVGALQAKQTLEAALNKCQSMGMRMSRQRRYILELLWQTGEHLSAREIYDRLNHQGRCIGHTSVYQNLEALSSKGVIECIERSDGRLYGNISDSHSHINCLDTQQILDIHVQLPPELVAQIEQAMGVTIVDYRIDFFGYRHPQALP